MGGTCDPHRQKFRSFACSPLRPVRGPGVRCLRLARFTPFALILYQHRQLPVEPQAFLVQLGGRLGGVQELQGLIRAPDERRSHLSSLDRPGPGVQDLVLNFFHSRKILIVHLSLRTERIEVRTMRSGPFVGPGFSGFFDIATEPGYLNPGRSVNNIAYDMVDKHNHKTSGMSVSRWRNPSSPSYFKAGRLNANTGALRACLSRQDAPRGRRIGKARRPPEGARVRMVMKGEARRE